MHVLVTGFPPFPNQPVNPTQQIVEALRGGALDVPGVRLSSELLPVEYRQVEQVFEELVADLGPDLVLSFGVGRQSSLFRFEMVGRNLDDAKIPDNAGEYRSQHLIIPTGPPAYHSSLELESLLEAVASERVSVQLSDDAGAYVCNHLAYYAMHLSEQSATPFSYLFTHTSSVANGFDLGVALDGISRMLKWFAGQR